jgi:hypothetical protein
LLPVVCSPCFVNVARGGGKEGKALTKKKKPTVKERKLAATLAARSLSIFLYTTI